jgi:predicted TPR repeat methyltransferase
MPPTDLASTLSPTPAHFLSRAYTLDSPSAATTLYSEWAATYDRDLTSALYASPTAAVRALLQHLPAGAGASTKPLDVLDAGCGTGLVGEHFARAMQTSHGRPFFIDGLDLTPSMLQAAAQKGIYRNLDRADLNAFLPLESGSYDIVLCVGTLTKGHVGPNVLSEFVRVARRATGGLIVATVHEDIWESGGYKAEVDRLGGNGVVQILSTAEFGIISGQSSGGRMVVLRKR